MLRSTSTFASMIVLGLTAAPSLGRNVVPINDTFCVQTFGAAKSSECEFVLLQDLGESDYRRLVRTSGYSAVRFDRARLQAPNHKSGLAALVRAEPLEILVDDYPLDQDGVVDWVRGQLGMVKSVGMIDTRLPRSHIPVMVINTHLHPESREVRIAQVIHLAGKVLQLMPSDRPVVLAGDFNADHDSLEMALLRSLLLMKSAVDPKSAKGKDVDGLFYRGSPAVALELEEAAIIPEDGSSYGIRARFATRHLQPKPLPLDSKELDARIDKALASLQAAREALADTGKDYQETRTMLAILSRSLREREPHDLLIDYFRTP